MSNLELEYNGNTYRWTGKNWGNYDYRILRIKIVELSYGNRISVFLETNGIGIDTYHTTDQLVEIGYMEKIEKPKTVWDLKDGDACYALWKNGHIGWIKYKEEWNLERINGNIFLTEKEAELERTRRQFRARKDRFIPKEGEEYYAYNYNREEVFETYSSLLEYDIFRINNGLAFRTEQECEEAMTPEIIEAFYTIS